MVGYLALGADERGRPGGCSRWRHLHWCRLPLNGTVAPADLADSQR